MNDLQSRDQPRKPQWVDLKNDLSESYRHPKGKNFEAKFGRNFILHLKFSNVKNYRESQSKYVFLRL